MSTEPESTPQRAEKRRWHRSRLWLLALPLAALIALFGTGAGNQLLWNVVASRVEAGTGWRIELENPRLGLGVDVSAGALEVFTPEGRRLVAAERVRARLLPGALFRARSGLRLEHLRIDGLWVDPSALPRSSEESDDGATYPVEIVDLDIRDAQVPAQRLDPSLEIPLGAQGAELEQWSAQNVTIEGDLSTRDELRFALRGTGEVNWQGAGLESSTARLEASLDGRQAGRVRVEQLTVQSDGLDAALEGIIGLSDEHPLRIAGRVEVEPLLLLDSPDALSDAARISWAGDLDLRSRLGQFRAEAGAVPLRWAWMPATSDEPSAARDQMERLATSLLVDASVDYRAATGPDGALSVAVSAAGSGRRGEERLVELDFAATEGRLDDQGRVDLASLRWAGNAEARGASAMDLVRLLPRSAREVVASSGLGDRPFEFDLQLEQVTQEESRGAARLVVGGDCDPQAASLAQNEAAPVGGDAATGPATTVLRRPCPRLEVAGRELEIRYADGTWDGSALFALVDASFSDIRGAPLRQLVTAVPDATWEQLIEGEDRLAGTVNIRVRDGRVDLGDARAELDWTVAVGAPDSVAVTTPFLQVGAVAQQPQSGEAARFRVEASLLGDQPGIRSASAQVVVPTGLDLAAVSSTGTLELRNGLPLLVSTASPWLPDPASARRLAERVDALDAPFLADVGWSGVSRDPRVTARIELSASEGAELSLLELDFDTAGPAPDATVEARALLRLDDLRESADGGVARSLLAAWADVADTAEEFPWLPTEGSLEAQVSLRWPRRDTSVESLVPATLDVVSGEVAIDGQWLRVGERWLERVELVASQTSDGPLQVERAALRGPFSLFVSSGTVEWADSRRGVRSVQLQVSGGASRYGIEEYQGTIQLDQRELVIVAEELVTAAGSGRGRVVAPLAGLAEIDMLRESLQAFGAQGDAEPLRLEVELPLLRITDRNQADLAFGPLPEDLETNMVAFEDLRLVASVPLDDLRRASASLEARTLRLGYRGYDMQTREPLRASLEGGVARLEGLRFVPSSPYSNGADAVRVADQLVVRARVDLAPEDIDELFEMELVENLQIDVSGPVDIALLQEFFSPASVEGLADLELSLRGRPDSLFGEVRAEGRGAAVRLLDPYVTELTDLTLQARLENGTILLDELAGQLNRGRLRVEGTIDQVKAELDAELERVRYRVDYGLSTELSGTFALNLPMPSAPADARGSLRGRVDVERGTLRRELNLDRELRTLLFAPTTRPGEVDPYAERIALDLSVVTSQGIRIRNNVADARATWDELRVRGTLAEPLVEGVVEADPGALVSAYGQTFRIDQGEVHFRGQPGVSPEIVLETTSSLEDPSIRRTGGNELDPFSTSFGSSIDPANVSRSDAFAGGLADYFGNELATGLGQGLTRVLGGNFNVRPVLVFGETEPSARLIVTREVDENVDIGVSVELRNPEDRLYLVDVHDLPVAPTLSAQVFTNESGNEGVTLQQNLNIGGVESSPFLVGEIDFQFEQVGASAEERLSERRLRRNLTVRSGERWSEGLDFDAEIDVVDSLRERGFPSPEVDVTVEERGRRRDLRIVVRPGIPAEIDFEGIEPAGVFRDAIRQTYRNDFFREASLGEMERQTRRALEAQGWTDVIARVTVDPAATDDGVDRVTVTSSSPRRLAIDRLSLSGVGREAALAVESVLSGRGSKIALLEGDEAIREQVLDQLAALGWTDAELLRVTTDREGRALVLDFDLRLRARIAGLRLVGFDENSEKEQTLLQQVAEKVRLQPGDPVIQREVAGAAIAVESALRDRGYIDARVQTEIVESLAGPPVDPFVQLNVDLGVQSRVAEITVPEEGRASPNWLREFIEIEPGSVVDRSKLRSTRQRILGTGVFSSVRFETLRLEGPRTASEEGVDEVTLALRTVERPRWKLAYGTRWESEEGFGIVVDGLDRNLLGRGLQLGVRGLWTERRQAARGFLGVPDMFGSKLSFESFLEVREREVDGIESSAQEATFQLAYPLRPTLSGRVYLRLRSEEEQELEAETIPTSTRSPVIGSQFIYDGRSSAGGASREDPVVGSNLQANALLRGLEGSLGTFASLDVSQSADFLDNDLDYVRAFAQVFHSRRAFELAGRTVVWAQSWRLGVIENSGDELPLDQRFFAGGEYSVRGYGRESLGPQEAFDDGVRALGGEALFVVNQELRFPVAGDFEGVVLFDSGNVWDDADELFDEFLSSAGLGVRYRSPLGLLRLDVAVPLDRREGDDSLRFYLGFGHVF